MNRRKTFTLTHCGLMKKYGVRQPRSALVLMVWRMFGAKPVLNTLRPRQNGRRFADDTFKRIFVNENVRISIKISLNFVPKGPINNIPALVQIMAWRRSGDKPLSESMMVSLLTHICVTRPQWVKTVLTYRQPDPNGTHVSELWIIIHTHLLSIKCILKCHLQNLRHFVRDVYHRNYLINLEINIRIADDLAAQGVMA